eukprot:gene6674-7758_t
MGLKDVGFEKAVEVAQDVLGLSGITNNSNPNNRDPSSNRESNRDQNTMDQINQNNNSGNRTVIENGYNSNSNDGVIQDTSDQTSGYQGYYSPAN